MLEQVRDLSAASWIIEFIDKPEPDPKRWKGNPVSICIPNLYDAYVKVFHPLYEDLSVEDRAITWDEEHKRGAENLTSALDELIADSTAVYGGEYDVTDLRRLSWRDLADRLGLVFHSEFSSHSITAGQATGSWPRYLVGPEEGTLDDDSCRRIVANLSEFTSDQVCYFLYDLITTDDFQSDRLFRGRLHDIVDARAVDGVHASPTKWWPEDRSWFVHTDYDLTFTLVGGSEKLVERILEDPGLECLPIRADQRIDFQADQVNQSSGK